MADCEVDHNIGTEEDLLQKHKKERKELLNKIQNLKKSCAKGDKKKKKEVAEEIACLESDLDKQQELELHQLKQTQVETAVDSLQISEHSEPTDKETQNTNEPRVTKAQRRRDKKAGKDKEREQLIAQQEEENKFGPRHLEEVKIKTLLSQRKLILHEVPSDGNCLYFAIAHQLSLLGEPIKLASVPSLRAATAEYLRSHVDDLRPFTCNPDTGLELSEQEYEQYCNKTESDSSAWGGQLELQALSEALKKPIEVLQAEGPPVVLGEQYKPISPITLTYHRHAFGLGEHYNSVQKLEPQSS